MYLCIYIYLYKRDTLSEATVTIRTVVTFVTWLISRTEFLVEKVFYNANFLQNSGIVAGAIGSPAANAGAMGSSARFVDLCLRRRFFTPSDK